MTERPAGTKEDRRDALLAAQEFVKYLVALSTGSLVLTAGLLTKDVDIGSSGKILLLGGWLGLGISIVGGILAYSRTVTMLANSDYGLTDRFLEWPGRVQQVAFLVGVLLVGGSLAVVLVEK